MFQRPPATILPTTAGSLNELSCIQQPRGKDCKRQTMSRVLLFLSLTVAVVAKVVAVVLGWSFVTSINDDSDDSSSDTSFLTSCIGATLILAFASYTVFLVKILFLGFLVNCNMDTVDSDFFQFWLRLSGLSAIMSLVGAVLLIVGLANSVIDDGPFTQGVIAVVGAVIAACADIVLAWVGTPEDRKEVFINFFCKQCRTGSYTSIENQ